MVEYRVDLADPRAPSRGVWEALTEEQRAEVVAALPSEIERVGPPEGDAHAHPKIRAREMLDQHFRRVGRRVYLAGELPVYYPGESMFAPDLIAVLDVPDHPREHWTVSHEERGLDFVLEIHVRGSEQKDFELNVERFARLGIPEYFAYAPLRERLLGWRLPGAEDRVYQPIVPQGGRWRSRILGLDLALEKGALRFYDGTAALLDGRELVDVLSKIADAATQRAKDEARRAKDEARRADEAAARAEREEERAAKLAARLRELGLDPDEPG